MNQIGFDKKFTLLAQEAHLTKNTILSGFDLLLKANFFQDKDGYFYSSFFHISIGMERLLKLAVVTHYMLTNNYSTPTIKQLKNQFGHDVKTLYGECVKLMPTYHSKRIKQPTLEPEDEALIDFFTEYATNSRYFNLNEVCEAKLSLSPLDKWLEIARTVYERHTPHQVRQKCAMDLLYSMDRTGQLNGFTIHLDESGHPMMVFDCLHRQYVIEKSAPLIIWRLVEALRPIHLLLEAMAHKASEYENSQAIATMVIPHYEDFFYFLLADKTTIKRRKRWLEIFNS
ncbi:hypothetical protein [Duganella sp. HH101]|uniref:hypothetical protein n=1 Tax=Duganella sp. HH101 TaxID=1781066 RepID=UPI0008756891|nr:hypothetical protein [Duganella sp. HH101]OFA05646.1 hypothetical protein DUGA2_12250 [Duganella sp. HH101]